MKKVMSWLFAISIIIFIFDWTVVGLKLFTGDYDITVGAYIGLACVIIMAIYIIYRIANNKCPHCKKTIYQTNIKYCPHCGKEVI